MSSLLDSISIAAPCSVGWDNMSGTEKIRFCNQCSKNVYDISAMSESEALKLLAAQETAPCLRLFRRTDGTIIFDNCPVGLRRVRNGIKTSMKFVSTIIATIISSVAAFAKDEVKPTSPGIRFDWTLSENGHTQPVYEKPIDQKPQGQFAQLGSMDRYSFFYPFKRELPPVYDLTVNSAFGKAINLAEQGKLTLAEIEFKKAFAEAEKSPYDPNLTEFIATEYAKLLRKKGNTAGAEKLIAQYKVAGVKTLTTISK